MDFEFFGGELNKLNPKEWFPAAFIALRLMVDEAWYLDGELPMSAVFMHCPALDPETGGPFLSSGHECSKDHSVDAWGAVGLTAGVNIIKQVPEMVLECLPEAFIVLSVGKYLELHAEHVDNMENEDIKKLLLDTYGTIDPSEMPTSAFKLAVLIYGMDGREGKQVMLIGGIVNDNALVWSDEKGVAYGTESLKQSPQTSMIGELPKFKNWPVANFAD